MSIKDIFCLIFGILFLSTGIFSVTEWLVSGPSPASYSFHTSELPRLSYKNVSIKEFLQDDDTTTYPSDELIVEQLMNRPGEEAVYRLGSSIPYKICVGGDCDIPSVTPSGKKKYIPTTVNAPSGPSVDAWHTSAKPQVVLSMKRPHPVKVTKVCIEGDKYLIFFLYSRMTVIPKGRCE